MKNTNLPLADFENLEARQISKYLREPEDVTLS